MDIKTRDLDANPVNGDMDLVGIGSAQAYDLETILTFRLARLQARLNVQAADLLRRHGGMALTHWRILLLLYDGLARTQKEMVDMTGLDKGQVSRIVDKLIADDLVTSESDKTDKRVHNLRLTPAAQKILRRVIPIMRQRQAYLESGFDENELAQLFGFLDRLDAASGKLDI